MRVRLRRFLEIYSADDRFIRFGAADEFSHGSLTSKAIVVQFPHVKNANHIRPALIRSTSS